MRFCSRPFTLACGHESIHLCNNAIQARYTNAERSSKLPTDNMWDNKTFIQFLKEQGHGDKWHTLIYPTMKKCLISKFKILNRYMNMDTVLPQRLKSNIFLSAYPPKVSVVFKMCFEKPSRELQYF